MKLDKILLRANSKFSAILQTWAIENGYTVEDFDDKSENPHEKVDGLVIFTQNQTLDREISELRDMFDHKQKPVHKIDINGTLMVGISNLDLWFEHNKCKQVLFIGADNLLENKNLVRYVQHLK
jgi:hypothetical protein